MSSIGSVVGGSSDRARRRLAWGVPIVVAGGVAAAVGLSTATASSATPTLPKRSAAQLVVAVQTRAATSFSGSLREVTNLGLPSLPAAQSSASLTWQSFLTGSHNARVWAAGPDRQRIALTGELSEADVVHNGRNVWSYTSATNTVTHAVLPARTSAEPKPNAAGETPAVVAAQLLKAVNPSTSVTVATSETVAGRPAYTLVLRPRDTRSTVHQVRIAVDAKKFVPLRVQVFGASSAPAFEIGFTSISFTRPAPSVFAFHVPAGAKVSNDPLGTRDGGGRHHDGRHDSGKHDASTHQSATHDPTVSTLDRRSHVAASPKVIGSGWTSVVELSGAMSSQHSGIGIGIGSGMLGHLSTPIGTAGHRLVHTSLVNAVLLPDGRAFVGAVSPQLLEHIAATSVR